MLFTFFWAAIPVFAHTHQQPKQKRKTPYVYKTEYEAKIKQVEAKANSALATANSVKRRIGDKFDKVDELGVKMQQVEGILNSAQFKIGLTSDSLNKTRSSVQEFKKDTEKEMATLHTEIKEQQKLIWGAIGLAFILSVGVFFLVSWLIRNLRKETSKQTTLLNDKLDNDMEQQNKRLTDEMSQTKMRLSNDISRLNTAQNTNNQATTASLSEIIERLDKMDKT